MLKIFSKQKQIEANSLNISENSFITNIIENAYNNKKNTHAILRDVNIGLSFIHLNYLLLVLAVGAICSFGLSFLVNFEEGQSKFTSIWSTLTLASVVVCFSVNYRFFNDKSSPKKINTYLLLVCVLVGIIMAFGMGILIYFQGFLHPVPHHTHVGFLTFTLVVYLVILGAFGNKPIYSGIIILISCLPWAYYLSSEPNLLLAEPYYYLYFGLFLVAYGIIIFEEFRLRNIACTKYIEHWLVTRDFKNQTIIMQANQTALKNEALARQDAEEALKTVNDKLESRINEKTEQLTTINNDLISFKKNLEKAHEAAGLATWDWDIQNKSLTGSNLDTLLGYDAKEIPALLNNIFNLLHPDDVINLKNTLKRFLKGSHKKFNIVLRIKHKHGEWLWLDVTGLNIDITNKSKLPNKVAGVVRDITLEKSVSENLNLSNKVFENSSESIFVLDADMNYISVNPSYEKVTGFSLAEIEGKPMFLWADDETENNIIRQKILEKIKHTGEYVGEITERNKQGHRLTLNIRINKVVDSDSNEITNYIGIFSDLSQQTLDKQKLSYLENYDQLTDLPNRRFFKQQLHTLITDVGDKTAVIRINIDRFRLINDTYGSKNSDFLLKQIAERLSNVNFMFWTIARLGGDDFGILFRYRSLYNLKNLLDAIYQEFEQPFYISQRELKVSLSMGISLLPKHGHQVDTLITKAEQALTVSKKNDGNQYFIYNQELSTDNNNTLLIENQLRHAINKGELTVFYQPKICLQTNKLIGFEGLVRWVHPSKGILMPNEFMSIAATTGLTMKVGNEILSVAFQQIAQWQTQGLLKDKRVALNIEVQQLKRGNFIEIIDNMFSTYQVDAQNIELEITESSIMDMPKKILPILNKLKSRHIKIAMDDFGTGYSSLAYLGQYPIDVLKIDRSFIYNMKENDYNKAIIKAIIAMGKSLGLTIVAEGIENENHLNFLKEEGCDIAQGYYFGKPVSALQATRILEDINNQ